MENIKKIITVCEQLSHAFYKKELENLRQDELNFVLSKAIINYCFKKWQKTETERLENKRAYYFSAEFLLGRMEFNNFCSLDILDQLTDEFKQRGINLKILESNPDPAIGNGGLGRLAACFLDSAATLNLPLDGYGILYRYGMFRQEFKNGAQLESPDVWLDNYGFFVKREEKAVKVEFRDFSVLAVPYDIPIIGYKSKGISTLRLWKSVPICPIDLESFNEQNYKKAVEYKTNAENISAVLYPNDTTDKGKILRLRQQYFFCSASLQDIFTEYQNDIEKITQNVSIQLNDTHPVVSIPEFIRLCVKNGLDFDKALSSAKKIFNFTNHTVMSEALEKWDIKLLGKILPEVTLIIKRIDKAHRNEFKKRGFDINDTEIIKDGVVNMAYLAVYCGKSVNGVAEIHTDILKEKVLKDWYRIFPDKFNNKTNGITPRRWLKVCNPDLSDLFSRLLGSDKWVTDLSLLKKLERYAEDSSVIERFIKIKKQNKIRLNEYMLSRENIKIDTDFLLDVQIKRIHEYKRQLLNILSVLEIYFRIKNGELTDFTPTVFLFGGKSAAGYRQAKLVIRLINSVAKLIENDSEVRKFIKVVFVANYDVSYAEKIIPAADISEQISCVGTEASGTGNMKLTLNGAVTLGTLDGANVEIVEEAGEENNYIFGTNKEGLDKIRDTYSPFKLYENNPSIKRTLDALIDGTLPDGGEDFKEIYNSLLYDNGWQKADYYFLLLDFNEYLNEKLRANNDAKNEFEFYKKCWINICNAGKFSSDRTVTEYAKEIWDIKC